MRKQYSLHAPFKNFGEQIRLTTNEKWDQNNDNLALKIQTIEDYRIYLASQHYYHYALFEN